MVLIEGVHSKDEPEPAVVAGVDSAPPRSEPVVSSSSGTAKRSADASGVATEVSGYESDGYETASESELNTDTHSYNDGNAGKGNGEVVNSAAAAAKERGSEDRVTSDGSQEQSGSQQLLQEGASREDASIGEEHLQKVLAQANDAKMEGNNLFRDGRYEEALIQYEVARQVVPEVASSVEIRSICHANRATCFFKMGRYEDTIKECTCALKLNSTYVKALLRRAEAHEKLEHYDEAIADMTKILELDPSHIQARRTVVRLKPLADEKREKMKEEMIGKLKDMGNSILGRFGMSVDNFKAVKDPNTGSYSISFQR